MTGIGLEVSQKQLLKLNTNMLQSLELMTLPISELQHRIERELEENPTLNAEDPGGLSDSYEEYADRQLRNEAHELSYSDSSAYGSDLSDSHQAWLEGTVSREETLQEHLMMQLGCLKLDDATRRCAETIISDLDSSGFFSHPLEQILSPELLKVKDEALEALHSLDPAGIAAEDYRESLCLQARDVGIEEREYAAFRMMVYDALPLLRQGKTKEASQVMGTSVSETECLFSFLKTLTPYPGARFSSGPEQVIIPDLSIKQEDGRLVLRMNDSTLPILSIDAGYQNMAKEYSGASSRDEKEASSYLKKQIASGENLISQLELRRSTLEKVGKVLMQRQKGFFLFGKGSLKPLTLQDVASDIGVHATTVSRITTSKYIDTDFGILSLKSLFSSSVGNSTGEDYSKTAVKEMVRKIIEENTTGKKLSDQKISDMLKDKGISCARRTVGKYRAELGLDSSFER